MTPIFPVSWGIVFCLFWNTVTGQQNSYFYAYKDFQKERRQSVVNPFVFLNSV